MIATLTATPPTATELLARADRLITKAIAAQNDGDFARSDELLDIASGLIAAAERI